MQITKEIQNSIAIHPMQTWEWGEARTQMGVWVEKITIHDSIFQFTVHSIPHTSFKIGYLPRSVIPSSTVLTKLYEFGKKNNLIFIKIEPYIPYSEKFKLQNSKLKLVSSPHPLFPEWTQILELTTPDEDELLKSFKPKTRYNIRLAEKKGVYVKEMNTEEGFAIFAKLYFDTCKRQRYRGHTEAYHHTIWSSLKDTQATILVAYLNDTPLAAYELLHFKETYYYLYGGSSVEHKHVMAPNLLMWEAIKLAKRNGAVRFDMWGSLPPDYESKHPWAGFTRFKEGYNTTFMHFIPSTDLVVDSTLYPLYGFAHKIREKFL